MLCLLGNISLAKCKDIAVLLFVFARCAHHSEAKFLNRTFLVLPLICGVQPGCVAADFIAYTVNKATSCQKILIGELITIVMLG